MSESTAAHMELVQPATKREGFAHSIITLPRTIADSLSSFLMESVDEASETETRRISIGYVDIDVPAIIREKTHGVGCSHTGSLYSYDMTYNEAKVNLGRIMMGAHRRGEAQGKTKRTYKGNLTWELKRGKVTATLTAYNVPLMIWQGAHGASGYLLSKRQCKELLELSTGGKIKYGQLVEWSEEQAERLGEAAVCSWFGRKVAKKVKIR